MTTSTMEKIKVMLAFDEGKEIQWAIQGNTNWQDCGAPVWNWYDLSYRIKPSMPRKFTRWFIETDRGLRGPYSSEHSAQMDASLWGSNAKFVAFEMTEILDNAKR